MSSLPFGMALVAFTLYSIHDLLIKQLSQSVSVIQIVFLSTLFTFPMISVWLVSRRELTTLRPTNLKAVLFRSISMVIIMLSVFFAFQRLPMAQVYSLLFVAPLVITALSGSILKERVDAFSWAAIVVGFVGVLVVLRPNVGVIDIGHIAAVGAAVLNALNAIVVRKIGGTERSVILVLYPLFIVLLVTTALLPAVFVPVDLHQILISALIAILALISAVLVIHAYRQGRAQVIAPMQYSQIIWGCVFGYLFFEEVPDRYTLLGTLIIIVAGVFIVTRRDPGSVVEDEISRPISQFFRLGFTRALKKQRI
jgi:drug/metabolite transporter (DMT)-like permease